MRERRIRKIRKNEKGQSLVEFALVVPLLLLLVIGIAEFGRAWMTKNILTGAAREAVRILAVKPPWPGGMTPLNRAQNILGSSGIIIPDNNIIIVNDNSVEYSPVSVTVNYAFPVAIVGFIPGLDCTTIPLSSTTTMRREY